MKSRFFVNLCLILTLNLLFSSFPVKAATIPSIEDIEATWDSNIDTSWYTVYAEYKGLLPSDRDSVDKVIAANAYRYLLSIGSKVVDQMDQQSFDNFLKAVSPFSLAYNGFYTEAVIHAAWSISSTEYKVFCANVIHHVANAPDYYDTHVLKNNEFLYNAGKGCLNFQYNDFDLNEYVSIYNNIFNSNVLSASGYAIGYYLNSSPTGYTGGEISLQNLSTYFSYNNYSLNYVLFPYNISNFNSTLSSYTEVYSDTYHLLYTNVWNGNYSVSQPCLYGDIYFSSDTSVSIGFYFNYKGVPWNSQVYRPSFDLNYLNSPISSRYHFRSDDAQISKYYGNYSVDYLLGLGSEGLSSLIASLMGDFFDEFLRDSIVYVSTPIHVYMPSESYHNFSMDSFIFDFYPTSETVFISPQFAPVNIYNNQVYSPEGDTFYYTDQMIENIVNNDYSNVQNGNNNTFYIDNYYIIEPVSGGGIQLVTSSSIVYNYITINNNNSTGGGITGPIDVRVINPEDLQNETIINENNDILNNYDFNFGDLDLSVSVNTGLQNANDTLSPSLTSGSSIVGEMIGGIPPDLLGVVFGLLALSLISGVIYRVTSG